MNEVRVAVFGPASGQRALELPSCSEIDVEQIAISEYEFSVSEGGRILILRRVSSASEGGDRLALILCEQVYEPHLRRLGHTFGAYLEFGSSLPDCERIVDVAFELVRMLRLLCQSAGRFVEYEAFFAQVQSEFATRSSGLFQLLSPIVSRSRLVAAKTELPSFYTMVSEVKKTPELMQFVIWFLQGLGPLACRQLFILDADSGTPVGGMQKLPPTSLLDLGTYESHARAAAASIDLLKPRALRLDTLEAEHMTVVNDNQSLRRQLDSVSKEVSSLREQLSFVKRRSGDDPLRLAPERIDARGALSPGRAADRDALLKDPTVLENVRATSDRVAVNVDRLRVELLTEIRAVRDRVERRIIAPDALPKVQDNGVGRESAVPWWLLVGVSVVLVLSLFAFVGWFWFRH